LYLATPIGGVADANGLGITAGIRAPLGAF
jgi:hypothetical protein